MQLIERIKLGMNQQENPLLNSSANNSDGNKQEEEGLINEIKD
jgi:hypothetical protein